MNRKNVFSYFMWFVYSMAVCVSLLGMAGYLSRQAGYSEFVGFGISGLWLLLCGLIVFLVYKLTASADSTKESNKIPMLVVESLIAVLLFVAGIILRVNGLGGAGEDAAYYELTKVAEGQVIPSVVHGAIYIYLQFLHTIYLIFGNKFLAGVWAQIILQMVAALFLYLAVRKMTGVVSAVIMLGFFMAGPMMTQNAVILSPNMLFLAICAIVLYACASCLKGRRTPTGCLITGILTAAVCYLDVIGVILLIGTTAGLLLKGSDDEYTPGKRWTGALVYLVGGGFGFFLLMAVDSFASAKKMLNVMTAWWKVFCPSAFTIPVEMNAARTTLDVLLLILIMAFGIFSFWCNRRIEGHSLWVLAAVLLILLQCFGMTTKELDGSLGLYIVFAILAGVSVSGMFPRERIGETVNENDDVEQNRDEDSDSETDEDLVITELPKVKLIENPLPLPKKHVKRVLDFDKELNVGQDDFDVDVDENDDYDI